MPVLLLAVTAVTPLGPANRLAPDTAGWLIVAGITLGLMAGGWLFARGTEFHYHSLRRRIMGRIRRPAGEYCTG